MQQQDNINRFWKHVQRTEHCWLWTASTNQDGYGRLKIKGRMVQSHRFSWELHCGRIPYGACVLHKCDTPRCVNPEHLFIGDRKLNMQDMAAKGRQRGPRGEDHHRAKLNNNLVHLIRLYRLFGFSYSVIAYLLDINKTDVYSVVTGKSWSHVH